MYFSCMGRRSAAVQGTQLVRIERGVEEGEESNFGYMYVGVYMVFSARAGYSCLGKLFRLLRAVRGGRGSRNAKWPSSAACMGVAGRERGRNICGTRFMTFWGGEVLWVRSSSSAISLFHLPTPPRERKERGPTSK